MDENNDEVMQEHIDAEIRRARTKAAAKEFDAWLESVEQRLCQLDDEVGGATGDLSLRKVLGMMMISHAVVLMRSREMVH